MDLLDLNHHQHLKPLQEIAKLIPVIEMVRTNSHIKEQYLLLHQDQLVHLFEEAATSNHQNAMYVTVTLHVMQMQVEYLTAVTHFQNISQLNVAAKVVQILVVDFLVEDLVILREDSVVKVDLVRILYLLT